MMNYFAFYCPLYNFYSAELQLVKSATRWVVFKSGRLESV